jgi:hypothetical protein
LSNLFGFDSFGPISFFGLRRQNLDHGVACEPLLVGLAYVALDLPQTEVAAPRSDLWCAATALGEVHATVFPQAVEGAALVAENLREACGRSLLPSVTH